MGGVVDMLEENLIVMEMSQECAHFFKSIGIPVQIVHGTYNATSGHCWLLLFGFIEFESTNLFPNIWNKNADKYHVYKIEDV